MLNALRYGLATIAGSILLCQLGLRPQRGALAGLKSFWQEQTNPGLAGFDPGNESQESRKTLHAGRTKAVSLPLCA